MNTNGARETVNTNISIGDGNEYVHGPVNGNTYTPTITTPNASPYIVYLAPPAVCPGCGRCNHCGRPAPNEFKITYGQTQS